MLGLFKQYVVREGHPRVPPAHVEDERNLGTWVLNQRKMFKEGKLSDERIRALDEAGINWDPHGSSWEKNYALCIQYALREGHTNVRADHQEDGEYIHRWIRRQKKLKSVGKLSNAQVRRCEQLPGWSWDLGDSWDSMFALMMQYKARNGHCNVPAKHIENGKKLGAWLDKHKQDKRNGKLDPAMQETFEAAGVQWELLEAQWEQYYLLLLQFVEREGHADVLQKHEEEGQKLGIWVSTQRSEYKKGKLSASRRERLERIGFIWRKRRGAKQRDECSDDEDEDEVEDEDEDEDDDTEDGHGSYYAGHEEDEEEDEVEDTHYHYYNDSAMRHTFETEGV